jgi:hypothetical protein
MSIKSASGLIIGSARAAGFSARPRGFAYPIGGVQEDFLPLLLKHLVEEGL